MQSIIGGYINNFVPIIINIIPTFLWINYASRGTEAILQSRSICHLHELQGGLYFFPFTFSIEQVYGTKKRSLDCTEKNFKNHDCGHFEDFKSAVHACK